MLEHNHLKQHDNTVPSMDVQLHVTNEQNSSTLCWDISTLLFWGMLDMPDQTQQILQDYTKDPMNT